jgi:nucleoside-triphosphatase THEP1
LEGLLAAMAKTQIKHSLEEIGIICCGVIKEQVREMVDRHGFTNIKDIYGDY